MEKWMDRRMEAWMNQRLIKLTNQLLDEQMSTNGKSYKKKSLEQKKDKNRQ